MEFKKLMGVEIGTVHTANKLFKVHKSRIN